MSIETNTLREWSQQATVHMTIPAPSYIRSSPQLMSYVLVVHGLENSPVSIHDLRFSITFFHRRSQTFFGRTYRFGPDRLAFYLTPIQDEDVVGICEVMSVDMAGDVIKRRKLIGWCQIFCIGERQNVSTPIYRGSPSQLTHIQNPAEIAGVRLNYSNNVFEDLKMATSFIPINTFVGPHEEVPGIVGGKLPKQPNQQLDVMPMINCVLGKIQVTQGNELENKLLHFAEEWKRQNVSQSQGGDAYPYIQEIRMILGAHNTWQFLGSGQPEAAVVLRLNKQTGLLESANQVVLKEVIQHNLCTLVFELECNIIIPINRGQLNQSLKIIAAYIPVRMDRSGEQQVQMITGPGKSITGRMLWEPNGHLDLGLICSLNFSDQPQQNQRIQQHQIVQQPMPDVNRIRSEIEAQNAQKIKELEMQLEQERRRNKYESFPQVEKRPPRVVSQQESVSQQPVQQPRTQQVPQQAQQVQQPEPQRYQRQNVQTIEPQSDQNIDYSYLDSLKPVPLIRQSQETAFVAPPQNTPIDLTRADKARLVSAGIRGLLDYDELPGVARPRLDVEAQDPLKASVFIVQFLAFRPVSSHVTIPQRMQFGIKFYNYSHYYSDVAVLRQGQDNSPWVLLSESENQEITLKYEIEPPSWNELDFADYLLKRYLTIEIWNADSMILQGICKVRLSDLLRQGRPYVTITKEFVVNRELGDGALGSIQLLIRNMGRVPGIQVQQQPNKLNGGVNEHKRKIRSKELRLLPEEAPAPITSEDQKKKIRVLEWKKRKFGNAPDIKEWEKHKQLKQVAIVREGRKPDVIRNALREYLSTSHKIHARAGQVHAFQYKLTNPFESDTFYRVVIDNEEVKLVYSESEWKWWVSHQQFDRPNEWNMINEQGEVLLHKGESIPLLFKHLSWEPKEQFIQIWIHQGNESSYIGIDLEIIPENSPIDHLFRYYQPEGRIVKLPIPQLYAQQQQSQTVLQCTLSKAVVDWVSDTEVAVQIKVPPAPTVLKFFLLAYSNPYCYDPLAVYEINLHSLIGVDVSTTMGQPTAIRLACQGDEARSVRLFSSDPDNVYFPNPYNQTFSLVPRAVNSLPAIVKNDARGVKNIRINLIDVYSKTLIHAWICRVESTASSITQVFQHRCNLNVPTDLKIQFANRSNDWALFQFRSSHPQVLQIKEPRLPLEGGAKGLIWIHISPQQQQSIAEVYVFANDTEENLFECILFKLEFI